MIDTKTRDKRFYRIRILTLWGLLLMFPCQAIIASPFHYAQVLPGVSSHHTMISRSVKDSYGMTWLLSGGVIYRYDGVNVAPFSKSYGSKLPFYEVDNLYADPWGRLWISTRNGVNIFDLKTWSFIEKDHPLGHFLGTKVTACFKSKNKFYIAGHQGEVWSVDSVRMHLLFHFDAESTDERRPLGRMMVADDEQVWFANGGVLYGYKLQSRRLDITPFPKGMFNRIEDLIPVTGGVLLRFYSAGYYVFDGSSFRFMQRSPFRTNDFTNWNHWSFEWGNKVIVFHEDLYMEFSRDTAFTLKYIGNHQLDEMVLHKRLTSWQQEGDEWLMSTDKGLYSVFPARSHFDFINTGSARGMIRQHDHYYFGGYGYLKALSIGSIYNNLRIAAPENNYYTFLELNKDTALVALEGDFLAYLIRGKVHAAPINLGEGISERFNTMAYCLARQSSDTLLVGTSNGIWQYSQSSGQVYPLLGNNGHFFSRGMRVQSISLHGDRIYFTTDEGCFVSQAGEFRKLYPSGSGKLNIYSHMVRNNEIFLATNGMGVVKLDENYELHQVVNVDAGLPSDIVYQMMWVQDALVLGTHQGLSIFHHGVPHNFYYSDGLPFEEFNHQAIHYDEQEQQLFMGGVGGYVRFDPLAVLTNTSRQPEAILLSSIRIGMKSNRYIDSYARAELLNNIYLPSDALWLSMDFARPDFYRQAYRMQFKVSPLMDEYQDMPASSQINLTGLAAGQYAVSVRMQPIDNDQPGTIHTWVIHKEPVFTETLPFYALLCIAITGILGFLLYERSQRTKGEYRLRGKISRDLHDDVGGILTGISMQADLLKFRIEEKQLIEAIGDQSRQATQMMDDIIWAVDSRNNDQESLMDRMKYVARQLLDPRDIGIIFEFEENERKIPQSVRQNLYLIFKEAIHNLCKHSNATSVRIGMHMTGRNIVLFIHDNGTQTHIQDVRARKGNGTRNMELRAEQINAHLQYGYTAGGYEVRIVVASKRKLF